MDADLADLIAAFRGGEVETSRREELLERLRSDDAFQQAFVDEIRMLGMLKAVQSMEPRWLLLHDELDWTAKDREGDLMRRIGAASRPRLRRRILIAAASIVLAAGLSAAIWQELKVRNVATPGPYQKVGFDRALAVVLRLDRVDWWPEDGPRPGEGDLVPAGRLRFRSGRVTISMMSGAVLTAEGPADLDLETPDRIYCRSGRLRTRVPKGAEGLVVASPGAAVLDLGTEFGVNVQEGGRSRVRVFKGRVEAMLRTGTGGENTSELLKDDRVIEIDPGAGEIRSPGGPVEFIAPTLFTEPGLTLDPSYAGVVKAAGPSSYWRFELMDDGVVPNEVSGGPALRATGGIRLSEPSGGNRSAIFLANQPLQYLTPETSWRGGPGPEYAVEFWFLAEAVDHSCLLSTMSPAGSNHHAMIVETASRNRHALHPPGSLRFLDRWPPDTTGGHNLYSSGPYVPWRWHHVVAQVREGRMELYLDGERSSSARLRVGHPTAPCQVVLGRLSTIVSDGDSDPENDYIFRRPFVGRIDEVALYDHSLPVGEIGRHVALGPRNGPHRP